MLTNLTPANAASFVYKRLSNGLYEDATLEANSRTIYVKRANQNKHGPRFGLFANDDLLRALWINSCGDGTSFREVMERVSGTNSAEWSIKYLAAK